jgi:hypothetical protein
VKNWLLTSRIFVLFLLKVLPLSGQNLVFNGDVSIVDSCSLFSSQSLIDVASNFFNPTLGTPELYHTCSSNANLSIPSNIAGYQLPFEGSGYLGFGLQPFHLFYWPASRSTNSCTLTSCTWLPM